MPISSYATTAAGNNTGGALFPENMTANLVNDSARQMQADIRNWYQDAEWITWGDTTTYVASTQFKISGSDVTARYSVGRRVRVVGSSTGTIYGKITTSSFSTDTTVTVSFDSGSLSNETLTVSIASIKGGTSAQSIDVTGVKNAADVTGTNTFTGSNSFSSITNTGLNILDTNASHTLGIVPGSNLTANRTLTITTGDADRALTMGGDATVSGTNTGDVSMAVQADMEAASSTTVTVNPSVMKNHPGVVKAWCVFNGASTGTNAPTAGYGVTSVTRNAGGDYTINFSVTFSSANYCVFGICEPEIAVSDRFVSIRGGGRATTSCRIIITNGSASLVDNLPSISVAFLGDF